MAVMLVAGIIRDTSNGPKIIRFKSLILLEDLLKMKKEEYETFYNG